MKSTQARFADLWCKLLHRAPMWPSHGRYECRTCGRRYPVRWQEPIRARVGELPDETPAQSGGLVTAN
jgi:hypothetical protein